MSAETERLLAEGPRSASEPGIAGGAAVAQAPTAAVSWHRRPLRRVERVVLVLLALVVLVGFTVGHLLGPGIVLALWLGSGVVHFVQRRRSR
jgi:hypothetical protein